MRATTFCMQTMRYILHESRKSHFNLFWGGKSFYVECNIDALFATPLYVSRPSVIATMTIFLTIYYVVCCRLELWPATFFSSSWLFCLRAEKMRVSSGTWPMFCVFVHTKCFWGVTLATHSSRPAYGLLVFFHFLVIAQAFHGLGKRLITFKAITF